MDPPDRIAALRRIAELAQADDAPNVRATGDVLAAWIKNGDSFEAALGLISHGAYDWRERVRLYERNKQIKADYAAMPGTRAARWL